MSFVRSNPLGWAMFETYTSTQCNLMDLQISRAIDGHAGGTYNPSASITVNNAVIVNSTGAAAANVVAITATGKGTSAGVSSTGGATSGPGIVGTGGAPNGQGVVGFGRGTAAIGGVYNQAGIVGVGGTAGIGVVGEGTGAQPGIYGLGQGAGVGIQGVGGATNGLGIIGTGGGAGGHGIMGVGFGGAVAGMYSEAGVIGVGGSTAGEGVIGEGTATAAGVRGTGGLGGGEGVSGLGIGTASGVHGTGGGTTGQGVTGTGGAGGGLGVAGYGNTTGAGVYGEGGATSAWGGHFVGGAPNGGGIIVRSQGTGTSVSTFRDAAGSNLRLEGEATDPTAPAEGDIWADSTDSELIAYFAARKHQLLDTWASISVTGGLPPSITVNNQNNVGAPTVSHVDPSYISVPFTKAFGTTGYATTAISDGDKYVTIKAEYVGHVELVVYSLATGLPIDHETSTYELRVIVKGCF